MEKNLEKLNKLKKNGLNLIKVDKIETVIYLTWFSYKKIQ